VRIEVVDTGVGIPYEDQPNVFKKFFRASNASLMQPNASGVGLFVAKTLIQAQGGVIDFSSSEGHGTSFWFTVPTLTAPIKR
jgi:two-component system phosphate regulon sensor histidine kinase PhoR